MLKKRYYTIISAMVVIQITTVSCKKLLETNPRQSIDSEIALQTTQGIEAAANAVYARLQSVSLYGRDMVAIPEVLADNAIHTNTNSQLRSEATNQPGAHVDNWQAAYYGINQINLVLEALERINASETWKEGIAGQMHFLRGLFYHDLARVYGYDPTAIITANDRGAVPIVEKGITDVSQIEFKARESVDGIYNYIYTELQTAYEQLARTNPDTGPHKATAAAAAALHSRVALYRGDYPTVISKVNEALGLGVGTFQPKDSYITAWRAETHPESIFEVKFNVTENVGANNSLRATFTTRANLQATDATTHGVVVVGDDLMSKYATGDIRRNLIMNGLGINSQRNEMTKFISKGGVKDLDNVPVIRVSELYLNRAEAYVHEDMEDLALIDLNKIRERSGLSPVSGLEGNALLDEIFLQRRIELAFEGHRFFDLKRLGRNIVKESGNVPFTDYRILSRIPIREVRTTNGQLRQNRGY